MSEFCIEEEIQEEYETEKEYIYIRFSECSLSISKEGKAEMMATIQALDGAESVILNVTLERYDGEWLELKSWERKNTGHYAVILETAEVQKDFKHRIEVYGYALKGAYSECLYSAIEAKSA